MRADENRRFGGGPGEGTRPGYGEAREPRLRGPRGEGLPREAGLVERLFGCQRTLSSGPRVERAGRSITVESTGFYITRWFGAAKRRPEAANRGGNTNGNQKRSVSQKHRGLSGSRRTGTDGNGGRQPSQLGSVRRQQSRQKGAGDCQRTLPFHG